MEAEFCVKHKSVYDISAKEVAPKHEYKFIGGISEGYHACRNGVYIGHIGGKGGNGSYIYINVITAQNFHKDRQSFFGIKAVIVDKRDVLSGAEGISIVIACRGFFAGGIDKEDVFGKTLYILGAGLNAFITADGINENQLYIFEKELFIGNNR